VADPIEDIIGDYKAFAAQQRDRVAARGIDVTPYAISHIGYRVPEWDQYIHVRGLLERHAVANREGFWNGRPMSLILFDQLEVLDGKKLPMVELMPPVHQRTYKMGMEHIGFVVGEAGFEEFRRVHRPVLTGQQFQGPTPGINEPYYILFEDFTHVKFHQRPLRETAEMTGGVFDGFRHLDSYAPQHLVTATGPNPLPRRED
jgi:predicted metalloenzyme YecM